MNPMAIAKCPAAVQVDGWKTNKLYRLENILSGKGYPFQSLNYKNRKKKQNPKMGIEGTQKHTVS